MKKDIEWLKKEIGTEMIELEPNRKERWSDVKYQTLRSIAQKINQLDEPEVLSQKWIDEHKESRINNLRKRTTSDVVPVDDLQNLIIPNQEPEVTLDKAFEKISELCPMTKEEIWRHLEQIVAHGGKVTYGEPEVLSQEWIDDKAFVVTDSDGDDYAVVGHASLRNLLVPKQESQVLSQENINLVLDDLKEYIKEQQSLSQNVGLAHTSAGNDTHHRQYDYVLECIDEYEPSDDLKNLIIPKQEITEEQVMDWLDKNDFYDHITAETVLERAVDKGELSYYGTKYSVIEAPTIPKYVAEFLELVRSDVSLMLILEVASTRRERSKWEKEYDWISENSETFARAWLDGYTVEEPLYYALIKGHELVSNNVIYWIYDKRYSQTVFINFRNPLSDMFVNKLTKKKWNELGVNDTNADFVRVEK